MKKPDQFERKRRTRDKANQRWIKNRWLVVPAFLGLILTAIAIASEVSQYTKIDAGMLALGAILVAVVAGGPMLIAGLLK